MKRLAAFALLVTVSLTGCHAPLPSMKGVFAPYGSTRVTPPATSSYGSADTYYQPRQGASLQDRSDFGAAEQSGAGQVALAGQLVPPNSRSSIDTSAQGTLVVGRGTPDAPRKDAQGEQVQQASFNQLVSNASRASNVEDSARDKWVVTETPIRVVESAAPTSSNVASSNVASSEVELSGMPVRDATAANPRAEPGAFVPQGRLIELAQLPDAPRTRESSQVGFGLTSGQPVGSGVRRSNAAPATALAPTPAVRASRISPTMQTASTGNWKPRYSQ